MSPLHVAFLSLLFLVLDLCFCLKPSDAYNSSKALCVVRPSLTGKDDAPAIVEAFIRCGQNGRVVFTNHTYRIHSVMNTTGLSNCDIELHGTLLVRVTIYQQASSKQLKQ
jgi:galacturan 1,4-alpha-galacturonidase